MTSKYYTTEIGDVCGDCYYVPWDTELATFNHKKVKHCGKCNCCNGRIPLQ